MNGNALALITPPFVKCSPLKGCWIKVETPTLQLCICATSSWKITQFFSKTFGWGPIFQNEILCPYEKQQTLLFPEEAGNITSAFSDNKC